MLDLEAFNWEIMDFNIMKEDIHTPSKNDPGSCAYEYLQVKKRKDYEEEYLKKIMESIPNFDHLNRSEVQDIITEILEKRETLELDSWGSYRLEHTIRNVLSIRNYDGWRENQELEEQERYLLELAAMRKEHAAREKRLKRLQTKLEWNLNDRY